MSEDGPPPSDRLPGARPAATGDDGAMMVPPDPQAYDTERSAAARRRGLATPYIPGGRDPDHARAEAEDRRYLRILVIMVLVIVLAGFVLGVVAILLGLNALVGNPG